MKDTEQALVQWLGRAGSPFSWQQNFCCVPNVSYGFLPWEADLLICSKSNYLVEIEVKVSASDWKNDQKKKKFIYPKDEALRFTAEAKTWPRIREFWYAAPMKLAERWQEFGIPDFAGVCGIDLEAEKRFDQYKMFRHAKANRQAPKMTDSEKAALARLGTIRLWTAKPGAARIS